MPMLTVEKLNKVVEHFDIDADEYPICVETGTYMGDTVRNMQPYFKQFHTIEISMDLYNHFLATHPAYGNVKAHYGDSTNVIPELLKQFDETEKCVFWLDGHFSNGCTSKGEKDVPLLEECKAIDELYKPDAGLILVDDLRLFGTTHAEDWEDITVENVVDCFTNFDVHQLSLDSLEEDCLCLYITRKEVEFTQ
jgi:hypothetical protein